MVKLILAVMSVATIIVFTLTGCGLWEDHERDKAKELDRHGIVGTMQKAK